MCVSIIILLNSTTSEKHSNIFCSWARSSYCSGYKPTIISRSSKDKIHRIGQCSVIFGNDLKQTSETKHTQILFFSTAAAVHYVRTNNSCECTTTLFLLDPARTNHLLSVSGSAAASKHGLFQPPATGKALVHRLWRVGVLQAVYFSGTELKHCSLFIRGSLIRRGDNECVHTPLIASESTNWLSRRQKMWLGPLGAGHREVSARMPLRWAVEYL